MMSQGEKAAKSIRRRITNINIENIVHEGSRLALASDIWRYARPSPKCAVLMTLSPGLTNARSLVSWLVDIIRQHEPGLKLEINYHRLTNSYAIYLSARYITYLKGAELLHLRKSVKAKYGGGMRDFSVAEASCFQGVENRDRFITGQEQALIVKTFLDMMRAMKSGDVVLKSDDENKEDLRIYFREGQPIVARLLQLNLVQQIIPLHDREQLQKLKTDWVQSVDSQPLSPICDYFGTQIGLYFAWLGHYTWALCAPAALGFLIYWFGLLHLDWGQHIENLKKKSELLVNNDSVLTNDNDTNEEPILEESFTSWVDWQLVSDVTFVIFGLFNCLWSSGYLELWKRRQAELVYQWGGSGGESSDTISLLLDPRPTFKAEYYEPSPVTGRMEPQYPEWKSKLFRFGVSVPVTAILIGFMICMCFTALRIQDLCEQHFGGSSIFIRWITFVPMIVYAGIVIVADMFYRSLAVYLNDNENYRTDEEYENCLIIKIVLFQCINAYGGLFYIAFYLRDMQRLRETLATLLISRQVIQNCLEVVVPYLVERFKISRMTYKMTRSLSENALREQIQAIRTKHTSISESEVASPSTVSPIDELPSDMQSPIDDSTAFTRACEASPIMSPVKKTGPDFPTEHGSSLRQRRPHNLANDVDNGEAEFPDSQESSQDTSIHSNPPTSPSTNTTTPRTATTSKRLPLPEFNIESITAPEICDSELECLLPKYGTPLDDHLEMFIQFGYVLLFSSAFPMAAVCALINNVIEIRVDAFKLCNNVQRPFGRSARNIGAWQHAMEIMGFVGVMVNCALIGQSGLVNRLWPGLDWGSQVVLMIVLEHVILALKWAIDKAIPDVPEWVTIEQAKMEFKRREAIKHPVDWTLTDTPQAGSSALGAAASNLVTSVGLSDLRAHRERSVGPTFGGGVSIKPRSSSTQPHKISAKRPTAL